MRKRTIKSRGGKMSRIKEYRQDLEEKMDIELMLEYFLKSKSEGVLCINDKSFVILSGSLFVYDAEKILRVFRLSRWTNQAALIELLKEEYCGQTQ